MIVSGANLYLQPTDVSRAEQLFSKAAVVVCQLEVPPETSLAALIAGKKHGGVFMHECVCVLGGWGGGGGGGGGSTHGSSLDFVRMCYDRQAMHEQQTRLHGKKYNVYMYLSEFHSSLSDIYSNLAEYYSELSVFCFNLSVFHTNLSALHTNLSAFQYGCILNEQTIFLQ